MKWHFWNTFLALFSIIGFIAWMWKLTHGMPLTLETGFFTAGSAIGIVLFGFGAVERKK